MTITDLKKNTARFLHRSSALFIGAFGVLHLGNHLFTPLGPSVHQQVLETFRWVYRNRFVEPLLWLSIVVQVSTGVLIWRKTRGKRLGSRSWQRTSGLLLAGFLVLHTSASLIQRWGVQLDSNFYWAAAVAITPSYGWFFIPYYIVAVCAFAVHFGMVFRPQWARGWLALGGAIGGVIVLGLLGVFTGYQLPSEYALN